MNKERICTVRGIFTGIYQWGEGWSQETARKWDEFFEHYKGIHWKAFNDKGTWYLVGVQGSIYMHPMDFRTVLHSVGGKSPRGHDDPLEDYFGMELDELKRICKDLTEACGGGFNMVAETQEVENRNLKQW